MANIPFLNNAYFAAKVGIGNTNPTKELEIGTNAAAETEFRMHSDESGKYFNIQSAGNFTSVKTAGSQNFILDSSGSSGYITFVTNASERMRVNYNGNVGIGTTSPSTKLHLVGGVARFDNASSNYLEIDGSDAANNHAIISNRFNQLQLKTNTGAGAPHISLLPATGGNVGIGTSSPSEKLEVAGNIVVNGSNDSADGLHLKDRTFVAFSDAGSVVSRFRSSAAGIFQFQDGSYNTNIVLNSNGSSYLNGGNVGIGTTNPLAKLQVSSTSGWGVFTERGIKDGSTSTYSHSYGAGNAHILGRATIFESSVTFSTLTASAATKEYRLKNASDKLTLASVVAGVTTEDNILVASGTNIGIGTSSPTDKLEVYGGNLIVNDGTSKSRLRPSDLYMQQAGVIKAWLRADGNSYLNGGNLGIGTSSPQYNLDIQSESPAIRIKDISDNNSFLVGADNGGAFLGTFTFDSLRFLTDSSEKMRIKQNGNVGIGTTNPSEKLEVAGNVKLDGDNRHIYFGGNNTFIGERSNSTELELRGGGNSTAQTVYIDNTGQIGVGTNNPQEKLDISAGNIRLDDNQRISWSSSDSNIGRVRITGNESSDFISFATDNSDRVRINNTGVGIGTTSVGAKLHVYGGVTGNIDLIRVSNGTSGGQAQIGLQQNDTDGMHHRAYIVASKDSAGSKAGQLSFKTRAIGGGIQHDAMIIKHDGKVGIGTTSPDVKLEVADSEPIIRLTDTRNLNNPDWDDVTLGKIQFKTSDTTSPGARVVSEIEAYSNSQAASSPNSELRFKTSTITESTATTKMVITSDGKVGIGATNPSNPLTVVGADSVGIDDYILHNGDSNTKFGFPSNDSFKVRTAGSDRFYINSSGNVGIGTTSPTAPLHIESSDDAVIRLKSTDNKSYISLADNDTNGYISSENSKLSLGANAGVNANNLNIDLSNNNVGIGTSSPSQKLEVNGAVLAGDYRGSNQVYLTSPDNWIFRSTTGVERMRITSAGFVGIGTTSPACKLHVAGSGNEQIKLVGSTGRVSINSASSGLEMYAWGSGVNIYSTQTDSVFFGRDAGVSNKFYYYDSSNVSTMLVNTATGRVGIGTTNPSQKLEVNGNIQATGSRSISSLFDANNYIRIESSSSGGVLKGTDGGVITTLVRTYGDSYLNGGNLGIGTTAPQAKLDISSTGTGDSMIIRNDDASSSAAPVLMLLRDSASAANGDYLGQIKFKGNSDTGAERVYAKITAKISDATNGAEDSLIETAVRNNGSNLIVSRQTNDALKLINGTGLEVDGDVGIGTSSPSEKLHVVGYAKADTGFKAGNYTILNESGNETSLSNTAYYPIFFKTNNSTRMTISNAGNVGIGTTSPSQKLHVNGTTYSTNGYKLNNGFSISALGYNSSIRFNNGNILVNNSNAAEFVRFDATNSRVGIGTTSPNAKLNVNGSVKIESTNPLYFGGSTSVPNWEIKAYGSGGNDLLINDTGTNSGDLIFTGQDFGVGTTNPLEKLHVSGEPHPSIRLSSSSDSNYNVVINCGYRNEALNLSVGGYKVFTTEGYNTPETTHLYSNNSKALSLASNQAATFTSTVTATNFINSSDERLKENIEKVCNNSLDVQWKTFEFKSDRGQKRYGVIAQELEKTNPEFVREDAEGFKSVAYIDLLIAKIAELEERIQTLENK